MRPKLRLYIPWILCGLAFIGLVVVSIQNKRLESHLSFHRNRYYEISQLLNLISTTEGSIKVLQKKWPKSPNHGKKYFVVTAEEVRGAGLLRQDAYKQGASDFFGYWFENSKSGCITGLGLYKP